MAERWGLCPDHESVVDPITGRASATCQCRPVTAPDPTLADRLEEARALSMLCGATGTAISHADAKATAVRLRKLDRIEAALGDVWTADEIRWAVGDGRVVKMAYHPLDEMLRRLADALDEGDQGRPGRTQWDPRCRGEVVRCPECGSDGPHTDAAGWRTCGTCHASWMVDPGRQVVRLARHGTTTSGIEAPADHDRCPDIEFLDMHAAIDALDGLGVAAEGLDGWTAEGIFQRVTERGEEGDVSPAWSKPDIYMIEVVEVLTNRLVTRTDFRNLRKVKVL